MSSFEVIGLLNIGDVVLERVRMTNMARIKTAFDAAGILNPGKGY